MRRLRLTVGCLTEGSSRLEERAKAWRLLYSPQIEVRPSPKLSGSSRIVAAAVLFQSLCLCLTVLSIMVSQIMRSEGVHGVTAKEYERLGTMAVRTMFRTWRGDA